MNRGVARATVFESDFDREQFLSLVGEAADRGAFEVHGYCLLDNHYHLLVRSREGRLAVGMKWLSGRYTQQFNKRYGRDGPLFRGRYASFAVVDDAHLTLVSRYIHLNPVAAGLVRHEEDWVWSSAKAYFEADVLHAWLRTDFVLEMFGPTRSRARYRAFVEAGVDEKTSRFYSGHLYRGQTRGVCPLLSNHQISTSSESPPASQHP